MEDVWTRGVLMAEEEEARMARGGGRPAKASKGLLYLFPMSDEDYDK